MKLSTLNDMELMALVAADDASAFQVLFDRYFVPLSMYSTRMLNDEDVACDIVQSVFIAIYEQRSTLEIHSSLKSFLYQSVRNRSLNEIKSRKVRMEYHDITLSTTSEESNEVELEIEKSELEARLIDAVESLPSQCRKIFELSRFDGVSNSEIAEKLNLSKRTVETQITKALRVMRTILTQLNMVVLGVAIYLFSKLFQ